MKEYFKTSNNKYSFKRKIKYLSSKKHNLQDAFVAASTKDNVAVMSSNYLDHRDKTVH